MSLNVCVYGNGAREEAIKDALLKSSFLNELIDVSDIEKSDLIVFGPEEPICEGMVDEYSSRGIKCIGVNKSFSRLESSKIFAKMFMVHHGIKCAKFLQIESQDFPQVVKMDGLFKGKGVKVVYNNSEKDEFTRKLAGNSYFIEEFLDGDELSVMSLWDGKNLLNFPPSRDFKLLSSDKNSPNTGGMGSYCPVDLSKQQEERLSMYLDKLKNALALEQADFIGFIYSGLIWTRNDWYVLEYNVRLGDPETQSILPYIKNDFLEILIKATEQKLDEVILEFNYSYSACLVISSEGYPSEPKKGYEINLPKDNNVKVYFAGVSEENGKLYSNGGRVLSICTNSPNPFPVLKNYAEKIEMQYKYYRDDIDISIK